MPKLKLDNGKTAQEMLEAIRLSLHWRKRYEKDWCNIIDFLKGIKQSDEDDEVYINMVHPHVKVVIPAIYSKNPEVIVQPGIKKSPYPEVMRKRAEVMRDLLKYFISELGLKEEAKLCILDAILTGHAWIKTGHEFKVEEYIGKTSEDMTIVDKFLSTLGVNFGEEEEDLEESYECNEKIVENSPWALRVSPFNMIVPTLSCRPIDLKWITERFIIPYEEVMEEEDYDTDGLKPSSNANKLLAELYGSKYESIPLGDNEKYCILYEWYDSKTKKVYTLAEDFDKPLKQVDSGFKCLNSKYHPYRMLRFNEVPDEFYPMSDIAPAAEQLDELNQMRTQMSRHTKRYNRRYISKPGVFDEESKAQLRNGEDGSVIETTNIVNDEPIETNIIPLQDAPMPPEVYNLQNQVKDDLFSILGTSDYATQSSGGARTATEASIIATQSRFRVEERIDLIGDFISDVLRNIAQLSMCYMSRADVYKIIGIDAIYWLEGLSEDDIRREFNFKIVAGTSAPINREVEKEQFLKFYTIVKDDPMFDQIKLRLELSRYYAPNNPEDWLNEKVARMIEVQRQQIALSEGQASEDAPESSQSAGRVPNPNRRGKGKRGDLQAPSERKDGRPRLPGGRGGTALARSPY